VNIQKDFEGFLQLLNAMGVEWTCSVPKSGATPRRNVENLPTGKVFGLEDFIGIAGVLVIIIVCIIALIVAAIIYAPLWFLLYFLHIMIGVMKASP